MDWDVYCIVCVPLVSLGAIEKHYMYMCMCMHMDMSMQKP